jgi:hypothetical protein
MTGSINLDQFFKDRDEAVFWAGVHKARLALNCVDTEGKILSRNWLVENGFTAKGWE